LEYIDPILTLDQFFCWFTLAQQILRENFCIFDLKFFMLNNMNRKVFMDMTNGE